MSAQLPGWLVETPLALPGLAWLPPQVTCKEPYEWKDGTEEEWEFAKAGEQQHLALEGAPFCAQPGHDRCLPQLVPTRGCEPWE